MKVTIKVLDPNWEIRTSDGRCWDAGRNRSLKDELPGLRTGDYTQAGIRRAYPTECRALKSPGDQTTFKDTKGYFRRGAGWQRLMDARKAAHERRRKARV